MRFVKLFPCVRTSRDTLGMFAPGERDLLAMYHEVEAQFPHGKEVYVSLVALRADYARAHAALQLLLDHAGLRRASRRHRHGRHGKQSSACNVAQYFVRHS